MRAPFLPASVGRTKRTEIWGCSLKFSSCSHEPSRYLSSLSLLYILNKYWDQGDSTPTASFDVDASYPWNSRGDGLLMQSLDFPVALVAGGSSAEVWGRAASNGRMGEIMKGTGGAPTAEKHFRALYIEIFTAVHQQLLCITTLQRTYKNNSTYRIVLRLCSP